MVPQNRHSKRQTPETPQSPPLAGGDWGEGETKGAMTPSPSPRGVVKHTPQGKPSPVKGEGE